MNTKNKLQLIEETIVQAIEVGKLLDSKEEIESLADNTADEVLSTIENWKPVTKDPLQQVDDLCGQAKKLSDDYGLKNIMLAGMGR